MAYQRSVSTGGAPMDLSGNQAQSQVAGLLQTLSLSRPGPSAGDSRRVRSQGFLHGTAEQGSRPRRRSRDRLGRADSDAVSSLHSRTPTARSLGPQNALDVEAAFETINDRLDTIERHQRLHAQSIAFADAAISDVAKKVCDMDADICAYKRYITETHQLIDAEMTSRSNDIRSAMDVAFNVLGPNVENMDGRLREVEGVVLQLRAHMQSMSMSSAPQTFMTTATPVGVPQPSHVPTTALGQPALPGVPTWQIGDPFYPRSARFEEQQAAAEDAAPSNVQAPPMPASFRGAMDGQELGSPFGVGDPFITPDQHRHQFPRADPGASAWQGGRPCHFEISRKKNELLFVFTQKIEDFELWTKRMVDHTCRSTMRWRHVLEFTAAGQVPITERWLRANNVDGINAWDLSMMLEGWLVDWFPTSMYNRRVQLAGGEAGNGLEMWRRLFREHKGNDTAIDYGGIQRLQQYPRYTSSNYAKSSPSISMTGTPS
jgi:hypothetical protein